MTKLCKAAMLVGIASATLLYQPAAHAAAGGFGSTTDTIPFFVTGSTGEVDVGAWTQNALNVAGGVNATGNAAVNGYVQAGNSTAICNASTAGAIRFNSGTLAFEGCNGLVWQSLAGGGNTIVEGGCQTYWSGCPGGYHATSYFSPGTYNCCDRCGNPAWRYTVCSQ